MDVKDALLSKLNPQQRIAAMHGTTPLLLIAGAGTGKTTTLVHRVAYQIACGAAPQRVMLLTFTRRAAQQMIDRLRGLAVEGLDAGGIWAGTFHAVSVRLLRIFGDAIELPTRFTVLDRSDAEDLLDSLIAKKKNKSGTAALPKKGTALSIHSFQLNSQWPLKKVISVYYAEFEKYTKELAELLNQYQSYKRRLGVADYDDLLLLMRDLLRHPEVGPRISDRFERVLVDEYQDTNPLQAEILRALCPTGSGLTVVGDDAQSIYSFRAATVKNILEFPKQFPDASVLKLEQNYRGSQPLLDVSNALIAQAAQGFAKELWSNRKDGARPQLVACRDDIEQAELIVNSIERHRHEGIAWHRQAVLFRAAYHSLAVETELTRRKIPFVKYGGLKFAESAHVKDLLAFLRLAENSKDSIAGLRILMLLPGIGPKKAAQCVDVLEVSDAGFSVWQQISPPSSAASHWKKLVQLLVQLAQDQPASIRQQLEAVMDFYMPLMEQRYDNAKLRKLDLDQLISLADRFESRQQMLVDLAIDPPNNTEELEPAEKKQKREPPLVLSTIHSAKGLEWQVVFVMNAASGMMPMPKAAQTLDGYEEERRLLYVGMTRAIDFLYVTFPLMRLDSHSGWSNYSYQRNVGGLTELIPGALAKRFQSQNAAQWKTIENVPPGGNGIDKGKTHVGPKKNSNRAKTK